MPSVQTDWQLINNCRAGDKHAFDFLVEKYQARLTRVVARYAVNSNDVNDITQDVFVKAFKALDKFRGESSFYTWIYRIAINTAKNYAFDCHKHPVDVELDALENEDAQDVLQGGDQTTPELLMLRDELESLVEEALQELPEDLRTTICLRELAGLAYEAIAEAMHCPVGTVRSRIFRARDILSRVIKPHIQN